MHTTREGLPSVGRDACNAALVAQLGTGGSTVEVKRRTPDAGSGVLWALYIAGELPLIRLLQFVLMGLGNLPHGVLGVVLGNLVVDYFRLVGLMFGDVNVGQCKLGVGFGHADRGLINQELQQGNGVLVALLVAIYGGKSV